MLAVRRKHRPNWQKGGLAGAWLVFQDKGGGVTFCEDGYEESFNFPVTALRWELCAGC